MINRKCAIERTIVMQRWWRSMIALVVLLITCFPLYAPAQVLSRHGDVLRIDDDQTEIRMVGSLRVKIGVEGFLFTTNTINGKIVPLRVANIRVSHLSENSIICRIIDRFRPLTMEFWFGAIFEDVEQAVTLGTLNVGSTPLRATVFINGERRGLTPVQLGLFPGSYSLRVSLNGYTPNEQTITMVSDESEDIRVVLQRIREIEEGRSADFYLSKGVVLFDTGDNRLARLYFEKAMKLMPGDAFTREMLVRANEAMARESQDAQIPAELQEKLRQVHAWRIAARRYMNQEDYGRAEEYVRNILDVIPDDGEARAWWNKIAMPTIENTGDESQTVRLPDGQTFEMVLVRGGTFSMGDQWGDGDSDEQPEHRVTVFDYWMGAHEVTNAQFAAFLNAGGNRSVDEDDIFWLDISDEDAQIEQKNNQYMPKEGFEQHPVVEVTWHGAQAFARWVGGRLPTEAEWEYAARNGGQNLKYTAGDTLTTEYANLTGISGRDEWEPSSPVGSFLPNTLGLYDMAGNVWEWCQDWYAKTYYQHSRGTNPEGPSSGQARILRGGSWYDTAKLCRVSYRNWNHPRESRVNIGFRIVMAR